MRTFETLDVVRCLIVGMNELPNLTLTSAALCQPQSFHAFLIDTYRRRFTPRSKTRALVCVDRGRVRAIAAVRPRSGPRSWEVTHLYAHPDSGVEATRLLEQAAATAARGGAERISLRVEAESEIARTARRAGFFPCERETLYRARSSVSKPGKDLLDANSRFAKRRAEHDHAHFRHYNPATPLNVRQLVGMTLEQWKDSREPLAVRSQERVLEKEGAIIGWLRTSAWSGLGRIEIALHPDYIALTPVLVDSALRSLAQAKSVVALVPEYAPTLSRSIEERGFTPQGEFATLVRSVARTMRQPAEARSSLIAE